MNSANIANIIGARMTSYLSGRVLSFDTLLVLLMMQIRCVSKVINGLVTIRLGSFHTTPSDRRGHAWSLSDRTWPFGSCSLWFKSISRFEAGVEVSKQPCNDATIKFGLLGHCRYCSKCFQKWPCQKATNYRTYRLHLIKACYYI